VLLPRGWFAGMLLAASLAACMGAQALSLPGFKNALIDFLLEKISIPGEFEVTTESVQTLSDKSTVLVGVRIADASGVWFQARRLAFSWRPSRLLDGEVQIDTLSLEQGRLAA